MKWSEQTRSFNPTTASLTVATTNEAVEASGNPWFQPWRLFRTWRAHFTPWALILSQVFGAVGLAFGLFVLDSSYTLRTSMQMVAESSPFAAEHLTSTYRPPEPEPTRGL